MFTQELISLIGCALIASSLLSLWRSISIKIVTGIGFISALLLLLWFLSRWHYYLQAMGTNLFLSFPVATSYESVIFLVILTLVVSGCIPRKFSSLKLTGAINMLCGAALLSLNFFQNVSSPSLFLPSLRSYWLVAHVFLTFISYALFFIAALLSTFSLFSPFPSQNEDFVKTIVTDGLIIFTIGGLIFGAIWAENSWGRFWSWDPKETWAFITWICYSLLLHLVWAKKITPKKFFMGNIACFALVIFTYIGVNWFFGGLHSYGGISGD